MKRIASLFAAIALAVLAFYSPPASAQDLSGSPRPYRLEFETVYMRNTTAASAVARNPFWTAPISLNGANGFTDSLVFRRGATTRTVYDTTVAFPTAKFNYPPNLGRTATSAVLDSTDNPWLVLRVSQDTTSYSFAGTSGGAADSIRFAAEYSYDGINWFSCTGTPTVRFDVVFMTSGQDGLQSPTIFGVEASPGEDAVTVVLRAHPGALAGNAFIVNRTLPYAGKWCRFIVGGAYSGQYKFEIASWQETN